MRASARCSIESIPSGQESLVDGQRVLRLKRIKSSLKYSVRRPEKGISNPCALDNTQHLTKSWSEEPSLDNAWLQMRRPARMLQPSRIGCSSGQFATAERLSQLKAGTS